MISSSSLLHFYQLERRDVSIWSADAMPPQLNPYAPPTTPATPWPWDRSMLSLIAFGVQWMILIAYCVFPLDTDRSMSNMPKIGAEGHLAMAGSAILAFLVILVSTISQRNWPLHLRCWFVAIDASFLCALGYAAHAASPL